MYKVMIVDDEPVIRYGLNASIPWESGMFEQVGTYANGKEALESFKKQYPDILITDIKMPVMDGIELARHALEKHPDLKIIFVSSYSDFEYVREGLKLGAVDYLLKPTLEPEDLLKLLKKCTVLIEQELKIKHDLDEHKQNQKEHHRKVLEQKLKMMLASKENVMKPAEWDVSFHKGYTVVYGTIMKKKELEEKKGYLYLNIKSEEITDTFYRHYDSGTMFSLYNSDIVLVLPYVNEMKSTILDVKNKLEKETGIKFTFGYQTGEEAGEFTKCFSQAEEACEQRFYAEPVEIFSFENSFKDDDEPNDFLFLLKEAVNERDHSQMNAIKEVWIREWEQGIKSPERVKREAGELLSIMFQRKVDIPLLLQKVDEVTTTETLVELKKLLHVTIEEWEVGHHLSFDSLTSHQQLMERALNYIQNNYTSELTLQKMADYTYISKNYFSLLFKKYMEQNFIDYVISLRVKKAEELLAATSLKIYEIAHKSGFNDVKYFSKLFKKVNGISPVEYREKVYQKID